MLMTLSFTCCRLVLGLGSATNQTDAVLAIERYISDIRMNMLTDKLKLNDDKTEFMLIGTKQQHSKVEY